MHAEILIDTNVFMYAAGAEHPQRGPCRAILHSITGLDGQIDGKTACVDTELFQELAYRYASIGKPQVGRRIQESILTLPLRVHPVDEGTIQRFVELQEQHAREIGSRRVSIRDLVHVAVMRQRDVGAILSADHDFDQFEGLRRIDPTAVEPVPGTDT